MNSYVAMCKKHEKEYCNYETHIIIIDDDNIKWDFGTFEQLQKSYNSKNATIQAIKALCLLVRSRQLDPATLPFAKMVM
jgi:hypothetical protein